MKRRHGGTGERPRKKRPSSAVELADDAVASLDLLLTQPILPITMNGEVNKLFNSYIDSEIAKICVFTKNEIMELYDYLRPSFAKFHHRGRRAHYSSVDSIIVFLFCMSSGSTREMISGVLGVSADNPHHSRTHRYDPL